jgi:signal transduction histidine kinase
MNEELNITNKSQVKRIIPTVVVGFLVLLTYFLVYSYRTALAEAENTTLMRLGGIVNSMALQIDGDTHQHLTMQYLHKDDVIDARQDSNYFKIHEVLKNNYEANMLHTPIYTIIFDSLSKKYVFGITSSEKPYYRHAYNSAPKELMEKHYEGAMIPMYQDEFGSWLSAFAAIKNKKGQVVGLAQADEKFDVFVQRARQNVFKNLLFSLLVFGVFLVVLIRILQPILKREQRDKEALATANQQIKQLDDFRKEMIANISHDLRTPMSSILGYAEILLQKKAQLADNEKDKYLNIIMNEAKRLNNMVGELFDLSKLEAGQISLDKEQFNIRELAQDILYNYDLRAKEKNIRLLTEFQDNLPLIKADIRWIDRVLQNLMDNAIKYVDEGGFVKFTIFNKDNLLYFKVCNSGEGIEKTSIPHIFDRYFKANSARKDSTGLGLAIVKKVIDLHEGNIVCECEDGVTTFKFSLPLNL